MKYYYLLKSNAPLTLNNIQTRYHKGLNEQLYFDKAMWKFNYLNYNFFLIEGRNEDELKDKIENIKYSDKIYRIAVINDDEELQSAFKYVRGSFTYQENDNEKFIDGNGEYYFDSLNGFVVKQNKDGISDLQRVLSDYVLMLAYIQKIDYFQECVANAKPKEYKNLLVEIYNFDMKSYFNNPLKFEAYQGRKMWEKIAQSTKLFERHDEMLQQTTNLMHLARNEQLNKHNMFITIVTGIFGAILGAVLSWVVGK